MPLAVSTDEIYVKQDNTYCFSDKMDAMDATIAEALQSGGGSITVGTYTGDGKSSQTITLDTAPSAVIVFRDDGEYSGTAKTDAPMLVNGSVALQLTTTGFTVSRNNGCGLNSSTHTYVYYAV